MKAIKYAILTVLAASALSFSACSDWLDVNTDPDNPTLESASYELELAHVEFYSNHAHQIAAWRTSMAMGDWTRYYNGSTYWHCSYWYPQIGVATTPYQWFLVGAGPTLVDMIEKAEEAGNYQYAGVGKVLYAYGYMLMTDLYGEMPYTDGLGESSMPAYDTGRTIYLGCLNEIDTAIDYLGRAVDSSLPALSTGDWWNNGDSAKWLKLANFLKARWINKLIKKDSGSYLEGKYDEDAILSALNNAMQSNSDNTIIHHTDDNSSSHDVLGWDEPVDYSPLYSVCGMNAGYMVTKMLFDNLTNFDGLGVEDPRADHIIPWQYSAKSENSVEEVGGQAIKWNGNWRRSVGVDMSSDIQSQGGPLRSSYNSTTKNWYINSTNADRLGDTVYVEATSSSTGYAANVDLLYRRSSGVDESRESGSFYSRVSAPTYVGTYAEACFIKAEVLFNQGDRSGAYTAYKQGVQASCELMNEQLESWIAGDAGLNECPSFTPMSEADIENFVENGIGTSSDLTLGRIMTQKRIALLYDMEIWNDMRRYDFDSDIFLGWEIPAYHDMVAGASLAIPSGKQWRRWRQCSHEYTYNTANLQAIGYEVPGADMSYTSSDGTACWNMATDAWTINVWWDSDQE